LLTARLVFSEAKVSRWRIARPRLSGFQPLRGHSFWRNNGEAKHAGLNSLRVADHGFAPEDRTPVAGPNSKILSNALKPAVILPISRLTRRKETATSRISVLAQQGIDAVVALPGTSWAGGTYVPISTSAPPERIAEILARCSLAAIVVDTHGAALLARGYIMSARRLSSLPAHMR
jgi:hypothetical protein